MFHHAVVKSLRLAESRRQPVRGEQQEDSSLIKATLPDGLHNPGRQIGLLGFWRNDKPIVSRMLASAYIVKVNDHAIALATFDLGENLKMPGDADGC